MLCNIWLWLYLASLSRTSFAHWWKTDCRHSFPFFPKECASFPLISPPKPSQSNESGLMQITIELSLWLHSRLSAWLNWHGVGKVMNDFKGWKQNCGAGQKKLQWTRSQWQTPDCDISTTAGLLNKKLEHAWHLLLLMGETTVAG